MCDDTNWTRDDFVADADAAHSALAEENQRLREEVAELRKAHAEIAKVTYGWEWHWPDDEAREYFARHFFRCQEIARRALAPTRPADADPDISGVPV